MQSGLQLILALGLVIAGGWLMYAVISGSPLIPFGSNTTPSKTSSPTNTLQGSLNYPPASKPQPQ